MELICRRQSEMHVDIYACTSDFIIIKHIWADDACNNSACYVQLKCILRTEINEKSFLLCHQQAYSHANQAMHR